MESKAPNMPIRGTVIADAQQSEATKLSAPASATSSPNNLLNTHIHQQTTPSFPVHRGPAVEVTKLLSFAGERFRASVRDQPDSEGLPGVRLTIVPADGGNDGPREVEWYTHVGLLATSLVSEAASLAHGGGRDIKHWILNHITSVVHQRGGREFFLGAVKLRSRAPLLDRMLADTVPGTEEFKESLDRALRSLDSYRRVVEQDTWRQHHLEGISSVQMAMQHVGAVAETVRNHDSLIVRMQSTIAQLKETVVENFSKTLRDAIEAQLEESDDVRRVVASLQKQQARDKVALEKRIVALETQQATLKTSMSELQQLRRGGQEKQDHTIHGVVHNMDLMRKEMAELRGVIERNKAEQVETNERLRHAQRVASETHSRFTADFTEIKRVVSQQRSTAAQINHKLKLTDGVVNTVRDMMIKVMPGVSEPLYSDAQRKAQQALNEIEKIKKSYGDQ